MSTALHEAWEITEFAEDAGIVMSGFAENGQEETRQMRMDKVLAIRGQLARGRYDADSRLDAILEKLLEVLGA